MNAIRTDGLRKVYPLSPPKRRGGPSSAMAFGPPGASAPQYAVLVNPLVYVAEGMRGALTPDVPHMPLAASMSALLVISALFWSAGLRSFRKRAIG